MWMIQATLGNMESEASILSALTRLSTEQPVRAEGAF
jgi:hypothetical protein